ncbi:Serine protease S53 [Mycena sanguinolenta]|uniref:Serine protease S53 n=1 Tax=Mycena sanguinolenta TaxID=230812 RepID=A0A8H7D2S5_9AGAR|nr:Serine protease S53 [Mycena sanguinolenta]
MLAPLFALAALSGIPTALSSRHSSPIHVVHEKRAADPAFAGWTQSHRLESDKVIPLRVGLQQQNLDQVEDLLLSVSHPESPTYGQHLSPEEIVSLFAPSHETIAAVKNWLVDSGLSHDRLRLSPSRGWIAANVTVAEAESLLNTEYHVYTHPSGAEQFGCHEYSVPADLAKHIDLIKPTVQFNHRARPAPGLNKRSTTTTGLSTTIKTNGVKVTKNQGELSLDTCDQFITPDCLRALYKLNHTPRETKKNTFGIVEFTPQAFLGSDLDLFFANFSPSLVGVRPIPVLIDGAIVQTTNETFDFNGESDLDLEYAMALTNPQPVQLLQTGDIVEGAGFDNYLDAIDGSFCTFEGGDDPTQDGIYPDPLPGGFKGPESCGIIPPPHTISISYSQDEVTISARSAMRQCTEYAKLGMMGTSIFYSSGDNGVAGNGGVCLNSTRTVLSYAIEFELTQPPTIVQPVDDGTVFNPSFPSTCPFVTSVGATQILAGNSVKDPESACEEVIFSGGGFSNIFPLPSYQAEAVTSFLKNHPPPYTHGEFNNSGKVRAFPDLSANGAFFVIGLDGEFELVFGTSASAPTTASIFTMINDVRISVGKKPVGFINPAIYSLPFKIAFNDITIGGNQGCGTPGFNSTTGWDPVTGVGTPNFELLSLLFLALP